MILDRVFTQAATGNGSGNVTWTAAAQQYALPPASIDTTVTYTLLDSGGSAWETGTATLAESGGTYTLTRGGSQTVRASSNSGSAISLTDSSAHTLFLAPDARDLQRLQPKTSAVTVTTADVTVAVNTHYQLTISGLTADRHLILPSGASAGDVISWEMMSDAPADYELILKGDTGVTVTLRNESFTAAEATRYFIEGETGKAIYDGSEWRINRANDGRIPCQMGLRLTTNATGESAGTWTVPTTKGGAWTATRNIGAVAQPALSAMQARRASDYMFIIGGTSATGVSSGSFQTCLYLGATQFCTMGRDKAVSGEYVNVQSCVTRKLNQGDTVTYNYYSQQGSRGLANWADGEFSRFDAIEIL
jgi:hypothetical protein